MWSKFLHYLLSLSLRSHLLLMVFLIALPAFGIIIDSGLERHKDAIDEGVENSRRLAYSIASEQSILTGNAQQLLTVLASLPEIQKRNVTAVSSILAKILKQSPQFGNIVVTDRTGDVWASALPMTKSFSLKNVRTFMDALKYQKFSAGEYTIGSISGLSTIGFGHPIINANGEFDGVIAVNINFLHFNDLVLKAGLPKDLSFTVIDRNGVIIARNLNPELFIGKKDKIEIFNHIKNGPAEGSFIDTALRGEKEIISYNTLRLKGEQSPYLFIRLGTPLKNTLAVARQLQLRNIVLLSVFLLASLILAMVIGKRCFLDRIYKLQEVSHRIAKGDLNVSVSSSVEGGELGDLAHSFDEMGKQIAAREQELVETVKEREEVILQLQVAMSEIGTLSSLIPICAYCKKIRDDKGYWSQLEAYFTKHADVKFSHGVCPECAKTVFD
jgi:HAMP domain-containing protein